MLNPYNTFYSRPAAVVSQLADFALLVDAFTGTDGFDLVDHTPDIDVVGGGWLTHFSSSGTSPAPEIQSNKATVTNAGATAVAGIPIDAGQANIIISAKITTINLDGAGSNGILLRYTDEDNYIFADLVAGFGGALRIRKVQAGSETSLASASVTVAINTTYYISITLDGDRITANGLGVTVSASSTFNNTATKHGLLLVSSDSKATKIDDLIILPLG